METNIVEIQKLIDGRKSVVEKPPSELAVIQPFTPEEEDKVSDFDLAEMVADYYSWSLRTDGITFYIRREHKWEKLSPKDKSHWKLVKYFLRNKCSNKPSQSKKRLTDVLACLHAEESMFVAADVWDSNPRILNTPSGIVDLTTGELHERGETDFVTMVTQCSPVSGPTQKFDRFMSEIFTEEDWGDDAQGVIDFVIGVMALCISGEQIEQLFFFLYGSGANGKSVLLDLVRKLLGDYAQTLATEAMTSGGGSNKGYAVAGLKGLRLATASEVGRTDRWDESLLKQLTGESEIAVRQIWGEYGEIPLHATLMVSGNHKPRFHGGDGGMVRRMVMVPFRASIPKDKQNRFLCQEIIEEEGDALLYRLVQRCAEIRRTRLDVPECIKRETEEYVSENDDIQTFFDDYLERADGEIVVPTTEVYDAYRHFKSKRGEQAMASPGFVQELMAKFGIDKGRKRIGSSNALACFIGLRLTKQKDFKGEWE